jgi:WhiB family redox-sensing transcriptional regulator
MTSWEPSKDLDWQDKAECAKLENRDKMESFFSEDPKEKSEARALCFSCPVRKDCVKWALENNTIWGIWGGKDEHEIRRTLSVNADGAEIRRDRYPQCLSCGATTRRLKAYLADNPEGGRWTTVRLVECMDCDFVWRSRTSYNAVNAYFAMIAEKKNKKSEKEKPKKSDPNDLFDGL